MSELEQAVFNLVTHNLSEPAAHTPEWSQWCDRQTELIQAVIQANLNASFPGKVGADF